MLLWLGSYDLLLRKACGKRFVLEHQGLEDKLFLGEFLLGVMHKALVLREPLLVAILHQAELVFEAFPFLQGKKGLIPSAKAAT